MLAVIQAGGKGSRMGVLTAHRAKPALPYAGTHQLIDIAMSNLANSGVADVWVSVQYRASTLDAHLQHGRPWDLDRSRGGYRRLIPEEIDEEQTGGFASGNADDLYRSRHEIRDFGADVVVVMSADQVFRLDLRDVVDAHVANAAACTIVTTQVPLTQAAHKAVVTAGADGRVRAIEEKPADPPHGTIAAEVFVYSAPALLEALDAVHAQQRPQAQDDQDTAMGDFAEHLLPWLIAHHDVRTWALEGYWMDMGRPETYLTAHRDLLKGRVGVFDDPAWPMRTLGTNRCGARIVGDGTAPGSLLSPGCVVEGTVEDSVLGPGVHVRAGAVVRDSVLLDDVVVGAGATVQTAIVDEGATIRAGAAVGEHTDATRAYDSVIAVVGHHAVVGGSARVGAGEQVDPGTEVR